MTLPCCFSADLQCRGALAQRARVQVPCALAVLDTESQHRSESTSPVIDCCATRFYDRRRRPVQMPPRASDGILGSVRGLICCRLLRPSTDDFVTPATVTPYRKAFLPNAGRAYSDGQPRIGAEPFDECSAVSCPPVQINVIHSRRGVRR
jgi:hypothetical protein